MAEEPMCNDTIAVHRLHQTCATKAFQREYDMRGSTKLRYFPKSQFLSRFRSAFSSACPFVPGREATLYPIAGRVHAIAPSLALSYAHRSPSRIMRGQAAPE